MRNENPMKIVLIEDDAAACKKFIECANRRRDIYFVGITDSSDEGLSYVKDKLPEAVILDLELNWGSGSGMDFLKKFSKMSFSLRPIVVVTTRNRSEMVQNQLHAYGVEWIFCKEQSTYSPDMVVEQLLDLRPFLHKKEHGGPDIRTIETPEEMCKRIMARIGAELNEFGISPKYKGRSLAEEAIYRLIHKKNDGDYERVFNEMAVERLTHYNNIVRPIETAILAAWRNPSDIDRLLKSYTAPVHERSGAPTPTEFIHYYADKVRRDI